MRRYRTEIVIPASRLVTLQLPPGLPPGRANVTVSLATEPAVEDAAVELEAAPHDDDLHAPRDDYEWWEEFGDAATEPEEPAGWAVRLGALQS